MTRVLVTKATSVLGRVVIVRLFDKGYTVRVMSRSPQRGTTPAGWVQTHMLSAVGLEVP